MTSYGIKLTVRALIILPVIAFDLIYVAPELEAELSGSPLKSELRGADTWLVANIPAVVVAVILLPCFCPFPLGFLIGQCLQWWVVYLILTRILSARLIRNNKSPTPPP